MNPVGVTKKRTTLKVVLFLYIYGIKNINTVKLFIKFCKRTKKLILLAFDEIVLNSIRLVIDLYKKLNDNIFEKITFIFYVIYCVGIFGLWIWSFSLSFYYIPKYFLLLTDIPILSHISGIFGVFFVPLLTFVLGFYLLRLFLELPYDLWFCPKMKIIRKAKYKKWRRIIREVLTFTHIRGLFKKKKTN